MLLPVFLEPDMKGVGRASDFLGDLGDLGDGCMGSVNVASSRDFAMKISWGLHLRLFVCAPLGNTL